MRRHWVLKVLAAGAVLIGAAAVGQGQASAVTNTPLDCDGVVAVAGGYRLTADTTCYFNWAGNDAFFDLGGHTLTGGFAAHGDRDVLRNGIVVGGMTAEFTHNFKISHMTMGVPAGPPSTNFWIEAGFDMTVEDSTFSYQRGGVALDFYFNTGGTIRNSTFKNNQFAVSIQKSSDVLIENNRFIDNGHGVNLYDEDGVGVDRDTVRNNIFRGNDYGVTFNVRAFFGSSPVVSYNTIRQNMFLDNGYSGIRIDETCGTDSGGVVCAPSPGNMIQDNIFVGNGSRTPAMPPYDDGVTARGSYIPDTGNQLIPYPAALSGFTLTSNIAIRNADLGFDVLGVMDGGRNIARANGNPSQCVGLSCGRPRIFGQASPVVAQHPQGVVSTGQEEITFSHG